MSYRGAGYRGPQGDRSRSPPRFADRRASNANLYDTRHNNGPPPPRGADAPRGPRSQFDGGPPPRGPPPGGLNPGGPPRTLRDAPPLGSGPRPFRERDFSDRRPSPPPRDRSPPRKFNEPRDFPPRDIDIRSARRASRDGPPSAGSNFSDNPPFPGPPSSFRGGFGRGRGRGDFELRGGIRGGRRAFDDRPDLFRRERSPPPRFGRDLSREGREPERREDRRFERREDDRRPDWLEREREIDRARRDAPPARVEARVASDNVSNSGSGYQPTQAPPINPERLAIIESSGADTSLRRPSMAQPPPVSREARRDAPPETPSYLNGRAETTANRYGSRGSSPPTQAPPVPAFSFSVAPTATSQAPKTPFEPRPAPVPENTTNYQEPRPNAEERPAPPANAPTAPKAAPVAPKAFHASPPPTAPKAPRALGVDPNAPPSSRLQGVRSLESLAGSNFPNRREGQPAQSTTLPPSPSVARQSFPHQGQPVPPIPPQTSRHADLSAPTGPKATRHIAGQSSISPRPLFVSPRVDTGGFQQFPDQQTVQRGTTPPPSAPSGPRSRSFSVSPKVAASNIPSIPTGPKAARVPSMGHNRVVERPLPPQARAPERPAGVPPFAPPPGPRFQAHRTWTRPGIASFGSKPGPIGPAVPSKRDASGEEKARQTQAASPALMNEARSAQFDSQVRPDGSQLQSSLPQQSPKSSHVHDDRMDVDEDSSPRKSANAEGHSAKQSFIGQSLERPEDLMDTSSDEDELDEDEDATLLEAKHKRKERELRAQMVDLSAREYRATSPLESIARLARLSVKDIQRHSDQQDDAMDLDVPRSDSNKLTVARAVQPSESDDGPEVSTPQGEDMADVAVQETDDAPDTTRRYRRPSPEVINLPYLLKNEDVLPMETTTAFQDNVAQFEESLPDMMALVEEELQAEDDAEGVVMAQFEDQYRRWREDCDALDRAKEQQEKLVRHQSIEPGPDLDTSAGLLPNPMLEGSRRLYKNSSEYEIEQVLKQSEETARMEQEKLDREAKKVQADMEKEARLPDQQTADDIARTCVIDTNRLRDPDALTLVFSYEPPADDFTESEQQIFVAAFKDTPKKWGEIASLLPDRTYKDCIAHYYANKWDGRFRDNRAKKFKGGRRGGRGKGRPTRGSALMADLNRSEDLIQATTDSATGRPKRAAAPTTFGEREMEAKASLVGQSPARKLGPGSRQDANGENGGEKPAKKPRRTGEVKPGRKGKSQLAALAAAPTMTPNKPFPQGMQLKDDLQRTQKLEEANLLMNVGNHPGMMHPEARGYSQEAYSMRTNVQSAEDYERSKPSAPSSKQGASSYWSVPEQTDFFKYIAHFGTDFAAIATHMGTKTQTMIKNHYQRQVEGGRSELEDQAFLANARRDRGEDVGPPPTPTPIIKRKYDNPQSSNPRMLAPQNDAMETDDLLPGPSHSAALPKHASPPQYVPKPRYTPSTQSTPVPAHRAVPSPLPASSTPTGAPMSVTSLPRGALQHPLGSRGSFMAESRSESRPSAQPTSAFRMAHESSTASRNQHAVPKQPAQSASNPPAAESYLQNLRHEQERAIRIQQAGIHHDGRVEDVTSRPGSMHVPHTHGSPANHHISAPIDRKAPIEERAPTPPRGMFMPQGPGRMQGFGIPSMSGTPLSSFGGRGPYQPSPKSDFMRPSSTITPGSAQHATMPMSGAASASAVQSTPAPEPPKRSTLLDILNNDPEESKPAPKRESLTSAPTRVASPAQVSYHGASTPQPISGMPSSGRREAFGQPSMGQSNYHRSSFGHQGSSTPGPVLKHEHSSGGSSSAQQVPHQEWQSRMGQSGQPSPPGGSPLDRDMRPSYFAHRSSVLGPMNPTRVNSPPPHMIGHSRTSSLSTSQAAQPPREQRNVLGGPPQSQHQSGQGLHASPYGNPQQPSPFSQPPPQPPTRALHSHSGSMGGDPSIIQRFGSGRDSHREEIMRREGEARAQQDRDDQVNRINAMEAEKQAERHHQYQSSQRQNEQRFQEQEMERQRLQQQQAFPRGPPPMPPTFGSPFGGGQHRLQQHQQPMGVREMSMRDAEAIQQQEEQHRRMHHQQQQDNERRRQEQQQQQQQPPPPFMRERDQQGDQFRRRTPFGGYGPPPQRRL